MVALNTTEEGLGWPVALIDAATCRAGPARVPRVNGDERDSRVPCLVGEEEPQLTERPRREDRALRLSSRDPFTDMGQLLDCHSACGAFGERHDLLADTMVDGALEQ